MNIYEKCPILESDKFIIRLFQDDDCDGDNFYYATKERMAEVIGFWKMAYENGWFVRLSIVDKTVSSVVGTVELCVRVSDDEFNNMGILRADVRGDYEQENVLYEIFSLVTPSIEEMLGCKGVLTKAPIYAVERIKAIQKVGFVKSEHLLIGKTGYAYDGYWTIK